MNNVEKDMKCKARNEVGDYLVITTIIVTVFLLTVCWWFGMVSVETIPTLPRDTSSVDQPTLPILPPYPPGM